MITCSVVVTRGCSVIIKFCRPSCSSMKPISTTTTIHLSGSRMAGCLKVADTALPGCLLGSLACCTFSPVIWKPYATLRKITISVLVYNWQGSKFAVHPFTFCAVGIQGQRSSNLTAAAHPLTAVPGQTLILTGSPSGCIAAIETTARWACKMTGVCLQTGNTFVVQAQSLARQATCVSAGETPGSCGKHRCCVAPH